MGLINDAEELFGTKDLYDIFSIKRKANEKEIKRAYYKLSLKVHPDKVDEDEKEIASRKFQVLSKAFYILSNKEKRSLYDETGDVGEDDDDGLSSDFDWAAYFHTVFPKVTLKDIDDHRNKYIGSEEEKTELRDLYLEHKGDLNAISECLMHYDFENEPRYKKMINDMINNDEVPAFDAFVKESKISSTKRKRKFEKEAKEAEKMLNEKDSEGSLSSLEQAISMRQSQRQSSFDNLMSSLEAKYASKKPVKRGKKKA